MNKVVKLSIIIPVYNRESTLKRCLDSVLKQDIKEKEIILINDGSTDGSLKICEEYKEKYSCIKIITIKNSGPAAARNKGILEAKGEYIAFVDSDDTIEEKAYSTIFDNYNIEDIDIIITSYYRVTKENKSTETSKILESGVCIDNNNIIIESYYNGLDKVIPSLWNKLYRNDFIKKYSLLINERYIRAEDYWFNFEAFRKSDKMLYIDIPYYNYYDNSDSVMHEIRDNQFEQSTETHNKLIEYNKEFRFSIDYNKFYKSYLYETATIIRRYVSDKNYKKVKNIMKNNTYKNALRYSKLLPLHIRLLNKITEKNMYSLAIALYKVWSKF